MAIGNVQQCVKNRGTRYSVMSVCEYTSHSSLLVARQGYVSRKLNQAFLLVDFINFNFVDEECSDIYI